MPEAGDKPQAEGGDGEKPAEGEGEKKPEGEGEGEGEKKPEEEPKKEGILPSFDPYNDLDLAAITGAARLPELLLALSNKYPYFSDLCKAQMLAWEFRYNTPD